jgi:hypothetical protein
LTGARSHAKVGASVGDPAPIYGNANVQPRENTEGEDPMKSLSKLIAVVLVSYSMWANASAAEKSARANSAAAGNPAVKELNEIPALTLGDATPNEEQAEIHRIKTAAAFKNLGGKDGSAVDFRSSDLVIVRGALGCAHGKVHCEAKGNTATFSVEITDRCTHRTMELHWFPYAAAFAVPKEAKIAERVVVAGQKPLPPQGTLAEKLKDPNITHLNLSNLKVTDADLAKLKEFKNLTHLYLDNNQVTDKGLANLSHMTALYQIYLGGNAGISDAGLADLKNIMTARVQIVGIEGTQITSAGLKQLQQWAAKQQNEIMHTQINHSIVVPKVYDTAAATSPESK